MCVCYMSGKDDREVELPAGPVVVGDVGVLQRHHDVARLVLTTTTAAVIVIAAAAAATTAAVAASERGKKTVIHGWDRVGKHRVSLCH